MEIKMDMSKKNIEAMVKELGSVCKTAKQLGCSRHKIERILGKPHAGGTHKPRGLKKIIEVAIKKKTLNEFRALYDKNLIIPQRINDALKKLKNEWCYEIEFAKMANVSLNDLSAYREAFAEYIVQVGRNSRRAWTGSKAMAAQMRKMV